jgi:hypothetical protein
MIDRFRFDYEYIQVNAIHKFMQKQQLNIFIVVLVELRSNRDIFIFTIDILLPCTMSNSNMSIFIARNFN